MGSQVCKNVQDNKNNQINDIDSKTRDGNCLTACCKNNAAIQQPHDKPLNPIQFSQIGSQRNTPKKQKQSQEINTQDNLFNQTPIKNQQLINSNQEGSTKQYFITYKDKQNMQIKNQPINSKGIHLILINKDKQGKTQAIQQVNSYQRLSVPYSVIKLAIKPQIFKQFSQIGQNFEKQHGKISSQSFLNWKLHESGCYINKICDGTTIIVTEYQYFRGYLKLESFVPDGQGILITQKGYYKGNFKQGRASGKGVYKHSTQKILCEGIWKNGEIQKGKLVNQVYQYVGSFKNSVPHGRGTLQIQQKKVKYSGLFQDGLFSDEQGVYKCPKYQYIGGFKNGKKNGTGVMIIAQNISVKNVKQKSTSQKPVKFQNDKLIM